jgi:hypothetical protein
VGGVSMSDSVLITVIICVTLAVLTIIGRWPKK